jgi:hypothetical protein
MGIKDAGLYGGALFFRCSFRLEEGTGNDKPTSLNDYGQFLIDQMRVFVFASVTYS